MENLTDIVGVEGEVDTTVPAKDTPLGPQVGLTPPVEQEQQRFYVPEPLPEPTMGSAEALWTLGNVVGQKMYHPEFRVNNDEDPSFDLAEYLKDVPEEDRIDLIDSRNASYANSRLSRKAQEQEASKVVEAMPWYGKYPGLLATGSLDPINLIPVGGALAKTTAMWRTYDRLGTAFKAAMIGGATGAASNVAAEAAMEAQGFDVDYMSASALGFFIGGGIGGATGIFSRPDNLDAITALAGPNKNDALVYLETDPNIKQTNTLSPSTIPQFKGEVPKAPDGGPLFFDFMKSDVQLMAEHNNELVREYGYKFASPTNAARDGNGVPVAIKDTAADRVVQWAGDKQSSDTAVVELYTEARNSGYKGTMDNFQEEISTSYREAASRQEHDVYNQVEGQFAPIAKKLDAEYKVKKKGLEGEERDLLREEYKQKALDERAKLTDAAYEAHEITFNGSTTHVTKGADVYREFYTKHLDRMDDLKMEGVKGINRKRLYMPRVYNNERIRNTDIGTLRKTVMEAVKAHPANAKALKNPAKLAKVVDDISDTLKKLSSKEYFLDFSYISPKELPLSTHLKQIKIKLDDAVMGNLLLQDAQNLAGLYSYKMTRQQAIQYKFGTTNLDEIRETHIKPIEDSLIATKGDMKIVKAMENAMSDLIGTLRMAPDGNSLSHQFTRLTGAYDSLTMGGSFGFNTIAEFATAMWTTGFRNIFNSQYRKAFGAVNDILFKETRAKNWEFANELIALGHMTEAIRASNAQRMSDMDAHFSSKGLDKMGAQGVETMFKWNGLRGSTAALEAIVSSNAIMDISRLNKLKLSGKMGHVDAARLARWGLDDTDLTRLAKAIDDNIQLKSGKLEALNLHKWAQEDVDILSMMTNRVIDESVIQADTVHIPTWLKLPKPMTKLLTRFLRYPAAAHGILLQRGMTDDKAGLLASIAGGIMTFGTFKYLQEQAQIAVGEKSASDAKFDIFNDDEAWGRLIIKSMNYSGGLGMTTVALDHGMILMGQDQLGTEYRQGALSLLGPTAGRLESYQTLGRALGGEPWTGTKDYNALKMQIPGATVPGISELLNATATALDIKQ